MQSRWVIGSLGMLVGGLALLMAGSAFAVGIPSGTGCTEITEVSSAGTKEGTTTTTITSSSARVCGVTFISNGANSYAEVFDSPDVTNPDHAQAKRIAEPGAVAANTVVTEFFGETGRPAFNSVGVRVYKGRALVSFQD